MDYSFCRSNGHRTVAPRLCFYLMPDTFGGYGEFPFQGERILVNKWSYGLRVPYMSLFSYHRWGESPIHKDDIVVFNNPAGIKEPIIDRREIYISRCIGVPGDTLLIDSLFNVVDRSTQLGPDRKQLYTYPQTKEQQLDSLLSILSIGPNELMGQHEGKMYGASAAMSIICSIRL